MLPYTPPRVLCFGLRCEVRFHLPTTAVYRSFLCIHDAPPGACHLEREIACGSGTAAAAALWCPPPTTVVPGPEGAWKERKGDDAFVLVALEELTLDSAAFNVLFEPCERFSVVALHRTTKMPSLGSVHARHADVNRLPFQSALGDRRQMSELEWTAPAKTRRVVKAEIISITHAGHDARDPSLAFQHVGRDPFGALDSLKETTIDGGCAEGSSGAEKKGERDGLVGVELDGWWWW